MSDAFTSNFSGRHGWRESCSSSEEPPYRQGETMTFIQMRCPYCDGKNVEEQNTYTIKCGAPRTMYHCAPCERAFSETSNTPIAQLKTPIAIVVQVLAALTEGLGINAATRLYGVSKNSIYRWGTGSVGWEPLSFGDLWANWEKCSHIIIDPIHPEMRSMTWNFYDSSAQDATLLTLNIIRPMLQRIMAAVSFTNARTVRSISLRRKRPSLNVCKHL